MDCVHAFCAYVCVTMIPVASSLFFGEAYFRREARGAESNICVDLYMCGICLWSLSAGPLPGVAAHTVKYEHCEAPCGYRHFSNAWIIQSESIPIDLPGAAI